VENVNFRLRDLNKYLTNFIVVMILNWPLSHHTAMPKRFYSAHKICQRAVRSPQNMPAFQMCLLLRSHDVLTASIKLQHDVPIPFSQCARGAPATRFRRPNSVTIASPQSAQRAPSVCNFGPCGNAVITPFCCDRAQIKHP